MSIKRMNEDRNQLAADMRALNTLSETEDRGFTPEERESWDMMNADIEALDARIDVALQAGAIEDRQLPTSKLPTQGVAPIATDDEGESKEERSKRVFDAYLRGGVENMAHEDRQALMETRALGVGTTTGGGFTVPTDFYNDIITSMKQYGGTANLATTITTAGGNPLEFPLNTDEAANQIGALLAENVAATDQDAVFAQYVMNAYKYTSGLVKVSGELAQDQAVNLQAWLTGQLGMRLGRIEAAHIATGTGSGQPQGIVTGASLEATAAGSDAIVFQDMLDLEHTVDPAYRGAGQASYLFNDMTLKALKSIVDGEGRPLWLPSVADAAPATINGQRYQIDQGFAAIGTGASSVVFGDISQFVIRRVLGIDVLRLTERFAEAYQVAYVGFSRLDSALLDTQAVAKLTHP